ncbi:MAG: class I SAM-dependent methyltransferase [Bacteroidia bacterium]
MELLFPKNWEQYELLDVGDFEKLERFGNYVTIRPEPQAVWFRKWSEKQWLEKANVKFVPKSSSSGEWKMLKKMPEQWSIQYPILGDNRTQIKLRLGLTSFKHVGVFPEQAVNWDTIYQFVSSRKQVKFLNLFAYTGGASLAAKIAGAEVTHVDSIKQVITWANENMKLSELDNIRWLVEDALKFVKKEIRRGNLYQGIILDPPAYGHGPNGEKWKLEDQIGEMIDSVLQILDPKSHLLILNAYSLGFSAIVPENLLRSYAISNKSKLSSGELFLPSTSGYKLPLGVWGKLEK